MTDRSAALFEPETLLPVQCHGSVGGGIRSEGPRRLMLAVLQDALECYQKYAFAREGYGQQLFEEAQAWIFSSDRTWQFSFLNICETLDIDPDYVRRGLERWRRRTALGPGYPSVRRPVPEHPAGLAAN